MKYLLLVLLVLTACTETPVRTQVVTKVVEKNRPLPGWVTIELPLPPRVDKVGDHLSRENTLETIVKLANCHRRLADKIARGEVVDPGTCAQ